MVNPTGSKIAQRTFEGCPPKFAGRSREAGGNAGPRWMVAAAWPVTVGGNRTRLMAGSFPRFFVWGFVLAGWLVAEVVPA